MALLALHTVAVTKLSLASGGPGGAVGGSQRSSSFREFDAGRAIYVAERGADPGWTQHAW